ncbi:BatA domain-containing protein [bacterium]|nr:BatA domain-containing protein [bacterium]
MIFLNPILLLGLAAAAIPLIIHLFNFRRPRRVAFSSLAFLHELKKSTMQRVRIKQWLLLALRTLALAALALAFARPTLEGALAGVFGNQGRSTMAVVLDHSTSMSLRDGSGAYLDQAKIIASELLNDFESGDELILVSQPTVAEPVTYQNQAAALEAIAALEPQEGASTLTAAIRAAADALSSQANLNRVLYVISDFQASTYTDSTSVPVSEDIQVVFLPVGTDGRGNIDVSNVNILSQIIAEGQPVQLEGMFTNYGTEDANGVVASVFMGETRVAQATLDIPAGTQASARFSVTPRQTGWITGRVEIEDNQFLYDNTRRFSLLVPEVRNLLLVNGRNAASGYLRLGLSSELASGLVRFETDEIAETGPSGASLGAYDAVILNGVSSFSSGEQSALLSYVNGGGGLLLFPTDSFQLDEYNTLLSDLGGGRILALPSMSEDGLTVGAFDRVDTDHPLFEGMFEPDATGKAPELEQPIIYSSISYAPGLGTEQTIIGLTGGLPFLQEIRSGQGSVLLFSVEAGVRWSDLPVRGLFLPLLYRSLYYLSATGSVSGESMIVQQTLQLRLAGVQGSETIVVRDETGLEFIPEQRNVQGGKVAQLGGAFFIPGSFNIEVNGETIRQIVVHPSPRESNLSLMDPEDAAINFGESAGRPVSVMNLSLSGGEEMADQLRAAKTGVELWNVFLGLALIFLLLEMLVSKHWKPESAL